MCSTNNNKDMSKLLNEVFAKLIASPELENGNDIEANGFSLSINDVSISFGWHGNQTFIVDEFHVGQTEYKPTQVQLNKMKSLVALAKIDIQAFLDNEQYEQSEVYAALEQKEIDAEYQLQQSTYSF